MIIVCCFCGGKKSGGSQKKVLRLLLPRTSDKLNLITIFTRGLAALFSRKNGIEIGVAAYTRVQAFWHLINMQEISRSYSKLAF